MGRSGASGWTTGVLTLLAAVFADLEPVRADVGADECYSVYRVEKRLDLSVNFGLSLERRHVSSTVDVHVRELPPRRPTGETAEDESDDRPRSFLFQLRSAVARSEGVTEDLSRRYAPPFVVRASRANGAALELLTTHADETVTKEYRALFDLFQYSPEGGRHRYTDGNGLYVASMEKEGREGERLSKVNEGYVRGASAGRADTPDVVYARTRMWPSSDQEDCFYRRATVRERTESVLSGVSMVESVGEVEIALAPERSLPASDVFFDLTDELSGWPAPPAEPAIDAEQASERLPYLLTELAALAGQDERFIALLLAERATWPYLADHLVRGGISDELGRELFWALDRIDSPASVSALTRLAVAGLDPPQGSRAVLALGSTSAPLDAEGLTRLKRYADSVASEVDADEEALIFVRMLGAMADRRLVRDPAGSADLRDFLYARSGTASEAMNAALMSAVGNLRESIDERGERILMQGLSDASGTVRRAAARAFSRIPLPAGRGAEIVGALRAEPGRQVAEALVAALGRAGPDDGAARRELVTLAADERFADAALASLVKADFELDAFEIDRLEAMLRVEREAANATRLAALILKNRRRVAGER